MKTNATIRREKAEATWAVCAYGPRHRTYLGSLPEGSVMEFHCWRCQNTVGLLLPTSMIDLPELMRAWLEVHRECEQTLMGARWDLICALHNHIYRYSAGLHVKQVAFDLSLGSAP